MKKNEASELVKPKPFRKQALIDEARELMRKAEERVATDERYQQARERVEQRPKPEPEQKP